MRAVEVATPQDFGEQPQLVGGTYPFALDACGGQRGLATDQGVVRASKARAIASRNPARRVADSCR